MLIKYVPPAVANVSKSLSLPVSRASRLNASCISLIRTVNLNLSTEGLPLAPGNSQSMSKPSKLYFLRYLITLAMKARRLAELATSGMKGSEPIAHPPTASSTFRLGFCSRRANVLAYRPTNAQVSEFRILLQIQGFQTTTA